MIDHHRWLFCIGIVFVVASVFAGSVVAQSGLTLSGDSVTVDSNTSNLEITVTLENTADETVNGPAIVLTDIPDDWTIDSVDTDGGTANEENTKLLYLQLSGQDSVSPIWTLSLPEDVQSGEYTLTANLVRNGETTQSTTITVTIESTTDTPVTTTISSPTNTAPQPTLTTASTPSPIPTTVLDSPIPTQSTPDNTTTTPNTDTNSPGQPGFGFLPGTTAVLLGTLFLVRRYR